MTDPRRYLIRMAIFLVAVAAIAGVLMTPLIDTFMANPALNGVILGVLVVGIVFILRNVVKLGPEVAWIERFRDPTPGAPPMAPPALLGPVATLLGERQASGGRGGSLSAMSLRSLLDSISTRLEESRDISRYLTGLLIFLGLLGTFWGLLQTVAAVGGVIGGLQIDGGDLGSVFSNLKTGLEAPLNGMATRSRPRCSVLPARSRSGFSICSSARRRTGSTMISRSGCPVIPSSAPRAIRAAMGSIRRPRSSRR